MRSCLGFNAGNCHYYGPRKTKTDLELLFASEGQANRTFDEMLTLPPVPTRGLRHVKKMGVFKQLSALLQTYLRPAVGDLQKAEHLEAATELKFGLALAAACQLCQYEEESRQLLADGPQGTCLFVPGKRMRPFWFRLETGAVSWGRGTPTQPADATVEFCDAAKAWAALEGELDNGAEVGLGHLQVSGFLPLADHLELILDRISNYLD